MFKYLYVLLTLSLIISSLSFGQTFHININGGYSFPASSSIIGVTRTWDNNTMETDKNIYGSYGRGVNIEGAVEMMISENIGIELGVLNNFGSTYEISTSYKSINNSILFETEKFSSHYWGINPAVTISSKINVLTPYIKFGVLMGFPELKRVYWDEWATSFDYSGGMSFGYTGALGVSLGRGWGKFLCEVKIISMVWNPTKVHVSSNVNHLLYDQDLTNSITYKQEPAINQGLTTAVNFNSISLNIGVQLIL